MVREAKGDGSMAYDSIYGYLDLFHGQIAVTDFVDQLENVQRISQIDLIIEKEREILF